MTEKEFGGLFQKWFDPVRRYVYYRCGDADLSTDIAQETFVRFWEKRLEPAPERAAGLLYKIAHDLIISHFRKEKVRQTYQFSLSPDKMADSPEDKLVYQELMKKYNLVLARLPEKQRTVFLMSRADGLKYNEIADRLGIGSKAVEKRMNLALKLLRLELEDYGKR